jgi:FAD:protein FMN transferase
MSGGAWAHHAGRAMGSDMEVLAWGEAPEVAVRWAVEEVTRLEACWSRFQPTSELSALNASAGRGPFACSPLLWAAVARAAQGWERTGGLFDPTVHDALVRLGYDRTFRAVPTDGPAVAGTGPVPGFGAVRLDADGRRVWLPAGVALDLGGIGKGLATDVLVTGLRERGATSAEVSMGGDLRALGPGPDADLAWWTSVRHPADGRVLFRFPVADEALVQSTRLLRRWVRGGRPLHHLVDPRTGWPADTGLDSVVATAPEAWFAEVVAKAVFVAGERAGIELAGRLGVDVWCVRADGTVAASPDVADATVAAATPSGR